ncbi:MAG: type II toxin-antitoxin system RelE/ParE family toxin, partial [Pyrinomonadaceae bacterium]
SSAKMTLPLELSPAAKIELDEAIDWYNEQAEDLSAKLVEAIDADLVRIQKSPMLFPVVHGTTIRQAAVQKFPFIILFTVEAERILVYSIFHTSRNPIIWRGRID